MNYDRWRHCHPLSTWNVCFWDERQILRLLDRRPDWKYLYDQCEEIVEKCDIARLAIVDEYGGIYSDIDTVCHRSLNPLIAQLESRNMDLFVARGSWRSSIPFSWILPALLQVSNHGFGSAQPNHPIFSCFRQQLQKQMESPWLRFTWIPRIVRIFMRTGPWMFTLTLSRYVRKSTSGSNIAVLSSNLWQVHKSTKSHPYVTHYFANSWI